MKTIIFIISVLMVLFIIESQTINAQDRTVNKDSLLIGGIYKFIFSDGTVHKGELVTSDSLVFGIMKTDELIQINKDQIKSVEIPKYKITSINEDRKFNLFSSFTAGMCIPYGSLADLYKPGYGMRADLYHLFDRVIGIGSEFQFNFFRGKSVNSNNMNTEYGDFSSYIVKANIIAGDLNPGKKYILYGFIGLGIQYITNDADKFYTSDPFIWMYYNPGINDGVSFTYGIGAGGIYKTSKKIGINLLMQYDKLKNYNESSSNSGFISIRGGIAYTPF